VNLRRTADFGMVALGFLLAGLVICIFAKDGETLYSSYTTAVGAVVGAIAVKHGIDGLAVGSGVKGAWRTLTTDEKPEEGPKP
jgi:hypothetical protein